MPADTFACSASIRASHATWAARWYCGAASSASARNDRNVRGSPAPPRLPRQVWPVRTGRSAQAVGGESGHRSRRSRPATAPRARAAAAARLPDRPCPLGRPRPRDRPGARLRQTRKAGEAALVRRNSAGHGSSRVSPSSSAAGLADRGLRRGRRRPGERPRKQGRAGACEPQPARGPAVCRPAGRRWRRHAAHPRWPGPTRESRRQRAPGTDQRQQTRPSPPSLGRDRSAARPGPRPLRERAAGPGW